MAITRRQFVTTMTTLAAAAGIGQTEISRLTEALAHGGAWAGQPWSYKPKVVWVHGAECTGCSTSLLSLFEDAGGTAIEDSDPAISTLAALDLAVGGAGDGDRVLTAYDAGHPWGHRTLHNTSNVTGTNPDGIATAGPYAVDIADVLLDFIDLQYHETVQAMGGDLAYKKLLADLTGTAPFVLVVEGAVQDPGNQGFWKKTGSTKWCSIGHADAEGGAEHEFSSVVDTLANNANCAQVIAIGQCASYGGYPACKGPGLAAMGPAYNQNTSQTGARGVYDFLNDKGHANAAAKVVNVPGCPTNPWWFVLTVVAWLVDATALTTGDGLTTVEAEGPLHILKRTEVGAGKTLAWQIVGSAIDSTSSRRLNAVYNYPLHSGRCPRYGYSTMGIYANHPGEAGCLALIGCKGTSTKSLCSRHGWNNAQPQNSAARLGLHSKEALLDDTTSSYTAGGHCITIGAPCMGCTQKGYPDSFSPFVVNR